MAFVKVETKPVTDKTSDDDKTGDDKTVTAGT